MSSYMDARPQPPQLQPSPTISAASVPDDRYSLSSKPSTTRLVNGVDPALRAPYPVATFGFGGVLMTSFPTTFNASAGYGASPYGAATQASANLGNLTMRKLSEILPASTAAEFPGPLQGTPNAKSGAQKLKRDVLAWLEQRIDEAGKELTFVAGTAFGRDMSDKDEALQQVEQRQILLQIVRLVLECDGKSTNK